MDVIIALLLILGALCFAGAAAGAAISTKRGPIDLVALGLLFWIITVIIEFFDKGLKT